MSVICIHKIVTARGGVKGFSEQRRVITVSILLHVENRYRRRQKNVVLMHGSCVIFFLT